MAGAFFGGCPNTTYGESVAVVGTTKVASANVIVLAALITLASGFITPITALLQTIPACVTGGVSLLLYGFIASSGIKMLINEKIDFNESRNIFIAAVILISGIGGLALKFGDAANPVITITSTAGAMILGIVFNLVLKENKEEVQAEEVKEEKIEE